MIPRSPKVTATSVNTDRPTTEVENRVFFASCRATLASYRRTVASKRATAALTEKARSALLCLGGDPFPANASLKDYDHDRFGPFLGVSDEGSAAEAIRDAALASPKVRARRRSSPLEVGVAVDAERLGGIGEVAVGPEEYADVWLACVDRVLITTNIGTRVNLRVFRREPRVVLVGTDGNAIKLAKTAIAGAFAPFVHTPDGKPRPLTVFVEVPRYLHVSLARARKLLHEIACFVASGKAAGFRRAPEGQGVGFCVRVGWGKAGQARAMEAIDLAAAAGVRTVMIDGVKRKQADEALSFAGLLDYFAPGIIGPLLRHAKMKRVRLRPANLPDTDTIARGIWAGLTVARSFGANLGKYGCFPLTLDEADRVVGCVQPWMGRWSAAPVFFVDQGLLSDESVDVGRDIVRGLLRWLDKVAARGVRVVLIDTIDKSKLGHLLRKDSTDKKGYLSLAKVARVNAHAKRLAVKVLWAGGLSARDAYDMGRLGVFGIYVTSAAAKPVPVTGTYVNDPALASAKEPQKDAVLRVKILLEAGFLETKIGGQFAERIKGAADLLLLSLDNGESGTLRGRTAKLADFCLEGWRVHWKALGSTGFGAS
jgi:hypothetical protein